MSVCAALGAAMLALGDVGTPAPAQMPDPGAPPQPHAPSMGAETCAREEGDTPAKLGQTGEADRQLGLLSLLDLDFHLGPWTFHGYAQVDGAAYDQAAEGPPESDFRRGGVHRGDALRARNLSDGSFLRGARLGGEGSFREHFAYRAMFELAAGGEQGEPRIAEVWLSYNRFAPYVIRIGAFPQPVNMDDATSSDSALFLERATAADLARSLGAGDGRIGVTLKRVDQRWMAAVSLTGPQIDSAEDYSPRAAIVARVSRAVTWAPGVSTHVGLNGTYVLSPADKKQAGALAGFPVRFLNTPEVDVDDTPLIDTGDLFSDHASVFGVEFAAQRRNLYVQAEAFRFRVERQLVSAANDPHFAGFYVQGSWILTGENRRFDQSRGAFSFPKVARPLDRGGWGAWELAFRYSQMDLNYHAGSPGQPPPAEGVRGGRQEIWATALLWYPRPRVRLMLNYLHVTVDRLNPARPSDPDPFGPPPATPPVGVQIGQSMSILALRARYSF